LGKLEESGRVDHLHGSRGTPGRVASVGEEKIELPGGRRAPS